MRRPWLWRPAWYRDFLLREVPKGGTGAEIGVYRGDFSARLLRVTRPRRLYLVDPWKRTPEAGSHIWGSTSDQVRLDRWCDSVRQRYSNRGEIRVERCTSIEFASGISDASLDWVYLDGDHRAPSVLADLEVYWPKLRPGGLLMGDDFGRRHSWFADGVTVGVNRFVEARGLAAEFPGRHQFRIRRP